MKNVKAIPEGFHSVVAYLTVKEAHKALEFYKKAFGAKEIGRITTPDNKIGHAELQIGNSRVLVAEEMPEWGNKSPKTLGGSPVSVCLYVEDVDRVFKQALNEGAAIEGGMDVKDQIYGDRSGTLKDPFGHQWIISTHIEDLNYEEIQHRWDESMAAQKK